MTGTFSERMILSNKVIRVFLIQLVSLAALARAGAFNQTVILLGLPLSGHSFVNEALINAGIKTCHNEMNRHTGELCSTWPVPSATVGDRNIGEKKWPDVQRMPSCYLGHSIQRAIAEGRPPLESAMQLGYKAFTQLDACRDALCIFPQYEALTQLTSAYPDALYIYTKRHSIGAHVAAIKEWDDLLERYAHFGYLEAFPGQAKGRSLEENGVVMMTAMEKRITSFFAGGSGRELKKWGWGAGSSSSSKGKGGSGGTPSPSAPPGSAKGGKFQYLELNVEEADASKKLAAFLGLDEGLLEFSVSEEFKIAGRPLPSSSSSSSSFSSSSSAGNGGNATEAKMQAAAAGAAAGKTKPKPSPPASAAAAAAAAAGGEDLGPGSPPTDAQPKHLVILVGMPKSGTTSIQLALHDLGVTSAHFEVNKWMKKLCTRWPVPAVTVGGKDGVPQTLWHQATVADGCYVGEVMQRALAEGRAPLSDLIPLGYRAFTQIDCCRGDACFFPQVEAIHEITRAYPHAFYIHTRRSSVASQVASMDAWDGMLVRFQKAGYMSKFTGQSTNATIEQNAEIMIRTFENATIEYFRRHTNLKFLDVVIERNDASSKVAAFLEIPSITLEKANVGHYNKGHTAAPTPRAKANAPQ